MEAWSSQIWSQIHVHMSLNPSEGTSATCYVCVTVFHGSKLKDNYCIWMYITKT